MQFSRIPAASDRQIPSTNRGIQCPGKRPEKIPVAMLILVSYDVPDRPPQAELP
jgi:hypothetical protein